VFLAIGLIAGITAFQIPLRLWQQAAPWLFVAGVALLVLVLIPHVGRSVNGAQRWIGLGPVNLQPSELMKLFVVLYAADYTARKLDDMGSFLRGFGPMALVMVLVGFLLLKEPDFGAFVVILAIATGILFLGGINVRIFGGLVVLLAISFVIMIWASPYRRERIFGFMDPVAGRLRQGLPAVACADRLRPRRMVRRRPRRQRRKAVLPARGAHRFPARGDCRGTRLRRRVRRGRHVRPAGAALLRHRPPGPGARSRHAGLVAQGIGIWLGVQGFINMGVNMGLLPTKGLTLPLMSFGGSGIVANCLALGILLRVDWENRHELMRGQQV
jgi:cell division protein FtsW